MILSAASALVADEVRHVVVFANGNDGYNAFRIPALIRTRSSHLLAFCEAREGGDASETDLVLKRSTDDGATWGPLQVVQESDEFRDLFDGSAPPITVGNPAPVVDTMDPAHPGRIWLPFTLENDRVFVTHSDDDGATWSEPREITRNVKRDGWGWYATGPVHSIQIQRGLYRGRLVVPCDHRLGAASTDRGPSGAHVVISDDHGQTWELGAVDDTYEDELNTNETAVVELNDGRLYFNSRDQDGDAPETRGHAYSEDGGRTFAPSGRPNDKWFVPSTDVLDPPVVQCSLLRAASMVDGDAGNVILFSGPDETGPTGAGRSDLQIRCSIDETRTWRDGLLVHSGPAAYSDMVRLGDDTGRIGVLFEAGVSTSRRYDQIRFAVFDLSQLDGLADHR